MFATNFSFFLTTRSEIRWRLVPQYDLGRAGIDTLRSGLQGCIAPAVTALTISYLSTPHLFKVCRHVLTHVAVALGLRISASKLDSKQERPTSEIALLEVYDDGTAANEIEKAISPRWTRRSMSIRKRLAILVPLLALVALRVLRPSEPFYLLMSWTLPLTLFSRDTGVSTDMSDGSRLMGNESSLAPPPKYSWLPENSLVGFEDWYHEAGSLRNLHYDTKQDPLYVGNARYDVQQPLKSILKGRKVKIKHIMLIVLESGRRDTFPLTPESFLWQRVAQSHPDGMIPNGVKHALRRLTMTAKYLVGSNDQESNARAFGGRRGMIHATNATSAAAYTLKSLVSLVKQAT